MDGQKDFDYQKDLLECSIEDKKKTEMQLENLQKLKTAMLEKSEGKENQA
jgi:hypothetical protein